MQFFIRLYIEDRHASPAYLAAGAESPMDGPEQTGTTHSDWSRAIEGRYDVVLCMFHDQGHIPVKVYGFEESITANLGLPFVRTSVDHGTAFDIAGKGIADQLSMLESIRLAVDSSRRRSVRRWWMPRRRGSMPSARFRLT